MGNKDQNNDGRYQGICSKATPKYTKTFESDEEGRSEYTQSLNIGIAPQKKQRITEREVMKSVTLIQKSSKLKPSKSFKESIQTYFRNDKHCDITQFTKMEEDQHDDFVMKERKKKRRPIRLHSSYAGLKNINNLNCNPQEFKEIANQCYVQRVINT